jgi:hypothetical protein
MASTERGPTQVRTLGQYIDGYTGGDGYFSITGLKGLFYTESSPNRQNTDFTKTLVPGTNISMPASVPNNTLYYMRGYYVAGLAWETWTSRGSPSTTPPSGHTLVNIVIEAIK